MRVAAYVNPLTVMVQVVFSDNSGKAVGGKSGVGFAGQNGGESALDPTIYTTASPGTWERPARRADSRRLAVAW